MSFTVMISVRPGDINCMLLQGLVGGNPNLTANGTSAIFPFLSQFSVRLGFFSSAAAEPKLERMQTNNQPYRNTTDLCRLTSIHIKKPNIFTKLLCAQEIHL